MKQAVVTKTDVEHAAYTVEYLKPAVEAISKIHAQVFRYSESDMAEVEKFTSFLRGKLDQAQAVIDRGQQQYADRDQNLLLAASTRYWQIDSETAAAQAQKQNIRNAYLAKVEELRKKFSEVEVSRILESPGREIAALDVLIAELKAEKISVSEFLADAPRFSTEFLTETKVLEIAEFRAATGLAR